MSKHQNKNPFQAKVQSPAPKPAPAPAPKPAPSEEDTPKTGNYKPAPADNTVEIDGPSKVVDDLVKDLQSVEALRTKVRAQGLEVEELRAKLEASRKELSGMGEALKAARSTTAVTDEDVQKLHGMFAEIGFERSRDGTGYVVILRGRRSQTGGRPHRFATFTALLEHLRQVK